MQLLTLDFALVLEKLILIAIVVTIALVIAMYSTYAERKVAAFMQDRRGLTVPALSAYFNHLPMA